MLARRRARGGNILMMVFALIFILITLVAALHHQQMVARQATMRAEGDLQFRVARRYAEAKRLNKTTANPASDIQVDATIKNDKQGTKLDKWGGSLFTGLPDIMIDKKGQMKTTAPAPGADNLWVSPSSSNLALEVFGNNKYRLVEAPWFGYAAYAPKGSLQVDGAAYGWSNPSFEDESNRTAAESYNGLPALLASKNGLEVNELKYGAAYVKEGSIEIKTKGVSVAYESFFPLPPYENDLKASLDNAKSSLDSVASLVDKTQFIKGGIFDGAGIFALFKSGGEMGVSLEQALNFPFPPIPGFQSLPPVWYDFFVSLPDPPDISKSDPLGSGEGASKDADKLAEEVKALGEKVAKLEGQVAQIQTKLDGLYAQHGVETDKDKRKKLEEQIAQTKNDLDNTKAALQKAKDELKEKHDDLADMSEVFSDAINKSALAPPIPQDRAWDKENRKTAKKGQFGWSYRALLQNILSMFASLITGDFDGVIKSFVKPVRIIHYGRTGVPDFNFGGGIGSGSFVAGNGPFSGTSTWTVPQGRSFRFNGDMEINGDLWLQRGSCFYVQGDLTVSDPKPDPFKPKLGPCGRIYLEEGATLIVKGDLEAEGSRALGSICVGSRPGQIHPITSSILCTGDIRLAWGVYSGAPLQDILRYLGERFSMSALNTAADSILEPFLRDVAPNFAKVKGPFYPRVCYFASQATTIKVIVVPIINAPVPLPLPLPPRKNALVPIFKGLTTWFAPQLNMTLGENLVTQSDWWFFGDGVVPIYPKFAPDKLLSTLGGGSFSLPDLPAADWANFVKDHYDKFLVGAAKRVMTDLIKNIVVKIISSVLPGSDLVAEALMTPLEEELDKAMDELFGEGNLLEDFMGDVQAKLLQEFSKTFNSIAEDSLVREVSGALVYSEGSIYIAFDGMLKKNWTPLMACGLFVAKNDVRINAKYTIGSVVALEGRIQCTGGPEGGNLLYNPYFSNASVYLPKREETSGLAQSWFTRAFNVKYGKFFDSGQAVEVRASLPRAFTTRGWNR